MTQYRHETAPDRKGYVLLVRGVPLLQLLQHPHLNLAGVAVLGDGANDLDGYSLPCGDVDSLDNLAEGALTKQPYHAVCVLRSQQ